MRRLFIFVTIICLVLIACESDSPVTPVDPNLILNASKYYPGDIGSSFTYKIDTALVGGNFIFAGTRVASFDRYDTLNGESLLVQKSLTTYSTIEESEIFLRRSNSGIFFSVDTSGFTALVGDSLIQEHQIVFDIDEELNAFATVSFDVSAWNAYVVSVSATSVAKLNVVSMSGKYLMKESISVPALTTDRQAIKIEYNLIIRIPNENDPNTFTERGYFGYGWFIEDIGLARIEGNGFIVNAISGGAVDLTDTSRTINQILTGYTIK